MAIGAQNRQQMNPAQFVSAADMGRLVDPRDYSRPNFSATAFQPDDAMRLVQDAMQKQAAFEAAFQQEQRDYGWQIVDRVQSTLDKGVTTAGKFENMRAQANVNQLDEKYGDEERKADLDQARSLLEQRKAQTEGTRADTAGKLRENELLGKYGERKLKSEIESTEVNTEANRNTFAQAIMDREKKQALFGIAADEASRIHNLYQSAVTGDSAAYDRLFSYALPTDLFQDRTLSDQIKTQLEEARQSARRSKTRELSMKSRDGYEDFAQKLYTDGPKGQALAARVVGILNQTPGFLTADQQEAIQNAYEVYKTRINPNTQVQLPEIIDTLDARRKAREADREELVRKPLSDSTINATIRAWTTVLQDMTASQDQKDTGLAILTTLADRNPELMDPRILTMIQLKRASQGSTGTTKPNATQDNKANFNRFD